MLYLLSELKTLNSKLPPHAPRLPLRSALYRAPDRAVSPGAVGSDPGDRAGGAGGGAGDVAGPVSGIRDRSGFEAARPPPRGGTRAAGAGGGAVAADGPRARLRRARPPHQRHRWRAG